jgi:hypothetical protein
MSGANPFFGPDIDIALRLTMGQDGSFSGQMAGDGFPYVEVFVVGPRGAATMLHKFTPTGNVMNLIGINARDMGMFPR